MYEEISSVVHCSLNFLPFLSSVFCRYMLGWTVRSEQENVLHQNLACSYENYGGSRVIILIWEPVLVCLGDGRSVVWAY